MHALNLYYLDVINSLKRTNIETIKDYLTLQLIPILLDMIVLNHDDNHVNICEELIKVIVLILCNLVAYKEWVVALQWACEMALLKFEHLEGWRFTIVVNVLLVGETIETDLAVILDAVLLHDLVDAVEDELWLTIVGLH